MTPPDADAREVPCDYAMCVRKIGHELPHITAVEYHSRGRLPPEPHITLPLPLAQRILAALEACYCVPGIEAIAAELRKAIIL